MLREWGTLLLIVGGVLLALGGVLWGAGKFNLPLGRLPGDLHLNGRDWSFSFPIITCILLSLILTVLMNVFFRR